MVEGSCGAVRVARVELGVQKGKRQHRGLTAYNIAMLYWQYCHHIGDIADMQCHIGNIADMTWHIGDANLTRRD
jgi:hypothetical protein